MSQAAGTPDPPSQSPGAWKVDLLSRRRRDAVMAQLLRDPLHNLLLIDMVESSGRRRLPSSEVPPQVLVALRDGELGGSMALRPSVVIDTQLPDDALAAFVPHFDAIETGLVKSRSGQVDVLWQGLRRAGRRALIDRIEETRVLRPDEAQLFEAPPGAHLRQAEEGDLEALVSAARASLREEGRPDPFDGDPSGFRRWVWGRLPRARLVEYDGRVVFVGYADVRRSEGWLVQGVYTWPEARRKGIAAAGMSGIIREAFQCGADHVQLAVVEGNRGGMKLYDRLGFESVATLRTILFH